MRHERRRVEVFDTPSGLGGSHTVSIVKELASSERPSQNGGDQAALIVFNTCCAA